MNEKNVNDFIVSNLRMLPNDKIKIDFIKKVMTRADESKYIEVISLPLKDPVVVLIISIFFGVLGFDRFLIGDIGMGILKLLTGGLCGILSFIDIFRIVNLTKKSNYNKILNVLK